MRQETILIIDDESSVRESLASFLTDEGYRVLKAGNGKTGLYFFFNNTIDVVITDLKMPEKTGIQVMEEISAQSPETPMIVISGYGEKKDIISALRMGAKDYITKPIEDLDMIHHVIRKVLENKYLVEENQKYRDRLEKSEIRYRTITEQIVEGVFTVDENEVLTFANKAFYKMLGYHKNSLLNRNLEKLTTSDSFETIKNQTLILRQGQSSRYEIQMINHSGNPVHTELACSPLFDEKNRYSGAIAVVRDISRRIELRKNYRKFMEEQARQSSDIKIICANCKSVRDDQKGWIPIEDFLDDITFSHGICPACSRKLYPHLNISLAKEDEADF